MTKIFWLSFCDGDRPKGDQFLGVCLVEVDQAEADEALIDVALNFPFAKPGAEWIAAATRKAHRLGCNPGGEVASMEIPMDHPDLPDNLKTTPRHVLLSREQLTALGHIQ